MAVAPSAAPSSKGTPEVRCPRCLSTEHRPEGNRLRCGLCGNLYYPDRS